MTDYTWSRETFQQHGITVVPANVIPGIGETRAIATLERIKDRRGEDHAKFVVLTLTETANSKAHLNESSLWAVSDIILVAEKNFPTLMANDLEAWFRFFDELPMGWLQFWSHDLDGIVPKRFAIVGMIYERMKRVFGDLHRQPDMFDDRASGLAKQPKNAMVSAG